MGVGDRLLGKTFPGRGMACLWRQGAAEGTWAIVGVFSPSEMSVGCLEQQLMPCLWRMQAEASGQVSAGWKGGLWDLPG